MTPRNGWQPQDWHADLFWGLRGGGANCGVVTAFEFDCFELGPEVAVAQPAYAAPDRETTVNLLRKYREYAAGDPGSVLPGFPGFVSGEERARMAYGPNLDRLAELKSRYDPENLLYSNLNVTPAGRTSRDSAGSNYATGLVLIRTRTGDTAFPPPPGMISCSEWKIYILCGSNGVTMASVRGSDSWGNRTVPAPVPPDDSDAWYAPDVCEQDEVHPGVVVTIRRTESFRYEVREPVLDDREAAILDTVESYFEGANVDRPYTREGAVERMAAGFEAKHRQVIDRLVDCSPAVRRRVSYHALCSLACLGELTPYALDDRIDVADRTDSGVVVHTDDYAPVQTSLDPETDALERFASERVGRHTVSFHEFEIPVIVYREHLLGSDPFTTKYAVREPDRLPGDEQLIEACKERVWETSVDGLVEDRVEFVRERARSLLARQLTVRNTTEWLHAVRYRLRAALAELDLAVPPVDRRFADDRLDDLLYYVLRDLVGHGQLTIPIRDPTLEDIEANRVGERVKVLPRADLATGRVPTNLVFEDESEFVNVVTQLAADDGTELNASNPSAKVNVDPDGTADETIRCAVALPTISEDGPHISIRKQASEAMTPVDLVDRGSLPTELVALLWLLYESHGVVLFSGPTGAGKTTLMNAHMPFIPYRDRPVSIDEGSREVRIPHETGVSLTTRDHEREHRRVTMADLMTQCNYLNPDVEVIAEINTPESFATFAETLNTGHGVVGTTHADDIETLVNRVIEKGVPTYLLREIDLVVFPRHVDGDRYVGEVVTFTEEPVRRDDGRSGTVRKDGTALHYETVCWRRSDGGYDFPGESRWGDDSATVLNRLADLRDQPVDEVRQALDRRHRYVQYLVREGVTDFDALFGILADLTTNEAATVERLRREQGEAGPASVEVSDDAG